MNLDILNNFSKKQKSLLEELRSLDAMEQSARTEMSACTADGRLEDVKIQRRIGEARLKLDLCASRRGHVQTAIRAAHTELKKAYAVAANEFNRLVSAKHSHIRGSIAAALKPFFLDQNQEFVILLNSTYWPVLHDIGRASWACCSVAVQNNAELVEQVGSFCRHARRHAKLCGLELGESAAK